MGHAFAADSRFHFEYEMVRDVRFPTMYPPALGFVEGMVDFHLHVGAGRTDPVALARHASRAKMRGLVFKDSAMPTVETARLTNEAVAAWAETVAEQPVECFGGIVLDKPMGGINVQAARHWLQHGARVVWLPVLQAANHLQTALQMPEDEARRLGIYVLDGNGRLLDAVREVVGLIAEYDAILSFAHLSRREMYAVAEEVQRCGLRRAVIDHPLHPLLGLGVEDLKGFAAAGIFLNLTYVEMSPFVGVDPRHFADVIRWVGVERVAISTDSGSAVFPDSVECMRLMRFTLAALGFDEHALGVMMSHNAKSLLKLDGCGGAGTAQGRPQ